MREPQRGDGVAMRALAGKVMSSHLRFAELAHVLKWTAWWLTTVAAFLGISPLIFFATGQTALLLSLPASLGSGLLFATLLILVVASCFYPIADDLRLSVSG